MNQEKTLYESFTFTARDKREIFVHKWSPLRGEIKAVLQIAHGMAEHGKRYEEFAEFLNRHGYLVYANDHRGHGKSADSLEYLGYLGEDQGFKLLVEDMCQLSQIIKMENSYKKIFLLGHSMGSFASQRFIMDYPKQVDGVILSGSNGSQGSVLKLGILLAKRESRRKGPKEKSKLLNNLSFASYNKKFKPNRTDFDWLSREDKKVDQYIEDPFCGEIFPASFYLEFFKTLSYIEAKENFSKIPLPLPIFIISGDKDPVGRMGRGVESLYQRYLKVGVKDLQKKLYQGARHEVLNEINRQEVMTDIVQWLETRVCQ